MVKLIYITKKEKGDFSFMYDKYDIEKFKERLKKLRVDQLRESQEVFAEKLTYGRQAINNWEKGHTYPRLPEIINICNHLNCDFDYLLGASEKPIKSANDAADYLHLDYNNVETLVFNKETNNFINFIMSSEKFIDMVSGIHTEFINEYVSKDILSAYEKPLLNKIKSAYDKYYIEIPSLDISKEKVTQYLKTEIPFKCSSTSKDSFKSYIRKNLSEDRINDIKNNANITDEQSFYDAFIEDTVSCTYEIMEYIHFRDVKMHRLYQMFMSLVDDYISESQKKLRKKLAPLERPDIEEFFSKNKQ